MNRQRTLFAYCIRRRVAVVALAVSLGVCTIHAELFQGIGVVNEDGSIRIESEAVETWNGCIEHFNEMCGKICDPYGTKNSAGGTCWDNEGEDFCSQPSSGLMGVGLCGNCSFVDFMPVPKATSFGVRHTKVTKKFSFNIFINGEPWRTNIHFPPSSYIVTTDSGEERVQEWRDTVFQDVPLDRDRNFIRIQRAGTGIPIIDYITVYPEGVGNTRIPASFAPYIAAVNVRGKTITYSLTHRNHVTLDIIDAAGRIVQQVDKGNRDAGTYTLSIQKALGRGICFVRLRGENVQSTTRLVTVE